MILYKVSTESEEEMANLFFSNKHVIYLERDSCKLKTKPYLSAIIAMSHW